MEENALDTTNASIGCVFAFVIFASDECHITASLVTEILPYSKWCQCNPTRQNDKLQNPCTLNEQVGLETTSLPRQSYTYLFTPSQPSPFSRWCIEHVTLSSTSVCFMLQDGGGRNTHGGSGIEATHEGAVSFLWCVRREPGGRSRALALRRRTSCRAVGPMPVCLLVL